MLKDHSCGELRKQHIGQEVTLAGWVHRRRDHGGMVFIDLRDREGIVQVVFNPQTAQQAYEVATSLRNEYVIQLSGEVTLRPRGTANANLDTGEVEVSVKKLAVLNPSPTPPFYINEDVDVDELLCLKYRYLYLRRQRLQRNLALRHRVIKFIRDFLDGRGFLEVETPILIKSTPEGARDYLVPSRLNLGKFYALPQSPQQLKQMLMVSGLERYFQIARCFRDEDLRADRQPEFTQCDVEMSFVDEEDILQLTEEMFTSLVKEVIPQKRMLLPFPRLTYREAMERYGTDKPDIRFGMELRDITDIALQTEFDIFHAAIKAGGTVRGICVPGCGSYTRHQMDELIGQATSNGARGLTTVSISSESSTSFKSTALKHITQAQLESIAARFDARQGDLLLIVADKPDVVNNVLDVLRREMADRLNLRDKNLLAFTFITDFPLLQWNDATNKWDVMHHPFTAPKDEDIALLDFDPASVGGRHYDLVCNGSELGSGSIRMHHRQLQEKIFTLLGYSSEEINQQFGPFLAALEYGAPPHGGIALGIDRTIMIFAGEQSIREVIAFPKNQNAVDMIFDAPSVVTRQQLDELNLTLKNKQIVKG
ncbi:MAG: aspartate--tRNA ligase [Dehalococcoidia bacterium]|nr:aspartate--tRNA ligase [Dehalococcoidia bacterium]